MPPAAPIADRGPARALKALRRFSRLITEAETPEALSRDLCRVLVEECGYRLAWVGAAEKDADSSVRAVASYGFEDGYLGALRVSWSDQTERGRGPTGVCVREGRACVALDMQADPRLAPWREDALRRGYRCSAAVPLGKAVPARGALSVYAAEPGAFGAEELELLEELAADLDRGLCALKAREERAVLALALEQSCDAVMLTDPQGNILLVNRAFEELTGFTRAEMLGKNPRLLKSGLMPPDYYERMWECLRAGRAWTGRVTNRRKDGSLYTADCRTAPVKAPGGTITFFVCVQHDVTREAALQEALKASEEKFRTLVERSLAGVYIIQDRRFRYASPRLAEILGYTVPETLALPDVLSTVLPEDQTLVAENMRRRESGEVADLHYRIRGRRKDGSLVRLEVLGSRVEYEGRPAVMGTLLDVTEQHELQERLMQAQKMEAVGRLAGGVAHDFNNLLTCIMGACDLALERSSSVDPRRLELEDIRRASDRAAALTRQLLAFSRKQVVSPRVLEAGAVVRGLEEMLRRLLREDIALEVDASCRARVRVDAGQLEQVVVNLVVNARDALPPGGRIAVSVKDAAVAEPLALLSGPLAPGRYAVVAVADTGCGIPPSALPHVLEPFFTTKGHGGTGLGLSTVADIVSAAGGAVGIDSRPGAGTTVSVFLPATTEAVAKGAAFKPEESSREGSGTILFVEDEEDVRRILRRQLVARGYEVLEASCAAEAEKVVAGHSGRIDLLVCDVVMPGISGWELAEKLQKRRQGMRLLFLSGYSHDSAALETALCKGALFLPKPVSGEELARKVREALAT